MLVQEVITQQEHRLLQEMNQMRIDLQLIAVGCARRFDEGGDIGDQANHTVQLATNQALCRLYQQKLRQLERAWARSCTGEYGICELCGAQIDPARLDAMPHATLCVRCQRRSEQ